MRKPTIITLLKADHKTVAGLFDVLDDTKAPGKRAKIFARLDQALSAHAEFEEERVYPLLQARKASKDMALEAIEEHAQIKRLLSELRDLNPADERWKAKVTVLAEDVRHHVKEEESDDLPELKKAVSEDILLSLAEKYNESLAEKVNARR